MVTGGNRGIGFEVCRRLALEKMTVVLTSRDESKGRLAAGELERKGLTVIYHQLDVTDIHSINLFVQWLDEEFGKADVLVNNAGVMLDKDSPEEGVCQLDEKLAIWVDILRNTLDTNVMGPLLLTLSLLPLMRKHSYGRIVNVSSSLGQLTEMGGGWKAYRISKTAINAMTRILAHETAGADILVNSCCPGWVRTDMGGPQAPLSVENGAETIIWLATLPPHGPTGAFFREKQKINW